MADLLSAIRERLNDRSLTVYELDQLLTVANEGGVQTSELQLILQAVDQTEQGLTPEMRALLTVRLASFKAHDALRELTLRPVSWSETQRLNEIRARIGYLIDEARTAKNELGWLNYRIEANCDAEALEQGRLENKEGSPFSDFQKLQRELSEKQPKTVESMARLRAALGELSKEERQVVFASISSNDRWNWQALGEGTSGHILIGLSDADKATLNDAFPDLGLSAPADGSKRFAGIRFEDATKWSFDRDDSLLTVPEGAKIEKWGVAGDFYITGKEITLPSGVVLESGRVRLLDGKATLEPGSIVRAGGVPLRSRDAQAQARSSGAAIIAGPGIDMALPIVDAEGNPAGGPPRSEAQPTDAASEDPTGDPAPQRQLTIEKIRYTLNEATLPDGTEVRRGTGRMSVVMENGRAIGMLDGSSVRDAGTVTYRRVKKDELTLRDTAGERGVLTRGGVVFRDDTLIGFTANAEAKIDGIELAVTHDTDVASYAFKGPDTYEIGASAVVTAVPTDRRVSLKGEKLEVRLGKTKVEVVSGGVIVEGGVVTGVLPGSTVKLAAGTIVTRSAEVRLLTEHPETFPGGNVVFMSKSSLAASGKGFSIEGSGGESLLASGEEASFGKRPVRNAIQLDGGSVRVRQHNEHLKPAGLEVYEAKGDITVRSGAQSFSTTRQRGEADAPGKGGPMMWVQLGGDRYELDPRPMWSSYDPWTDTGRTHKLERIHNTARFGGGVARHTESILSGRTQLARDTTQVPAELIVNVQQSLSYYLDRRVEATGRFDAATEEAVKIFQRLMLLEQTGVIDAATMKALDEVAPPASQPSVLRSEGRFGPPVAGQVSAIISGTAEAIRYRGKSYPTPSGELIARVQQTLSEQGFHTSADGLFGPGTAGTLERFQRDKGLPATGAIDAATMRALVDASPSTTYSTVKPRDKVMVMIAMNDEVPDELKRFRQLAEQRGAKPVIIGLPDGEYKSAKDLARFLGMAERGEIDLDWLVPSGHSTGSSTWGKHGRFEYSDLQQWAKVFPRAFAQIEKLSLLNCYNVTPERARGYWPSIFPNLVGAAGFMYSAPGKESQASDEFLLNSGVLMAQLPKGEVPSASLAGDIARKFETDSVILYQNAAIWLRTPEGKDGHYGLTAAAKLEMRKKGAQEELRAIPAELKEAYDNYFKAETDEFADPPTGHSTVLRDYLGAVQHVLDSWESRLSRYRAWHDQRERTMAMHRARREQDPSYEIPSVPTPEEFQGAYSWERSFNETAELRGKILSLIKHKDIRKQFGAFYARNIEAFNALLSEELGKQGKKPTLLASPDALAHMNRKQVLEHLKAVGESLDQVLSEKRYGVIQQPEWSMMKGKAPGERVMASPQAFYERAVAFLKALDPSYIQPEWLDDQLLANDLQRNVYTVVQAEERASPQAHANNWYDF